MATDLLVLGLDGVLFNTEAAHFLSSNNALEKCGIRHGWSIEQYRNAALVHGAGNVIASLAEKPDSAIGRLDVGALSNEKNQSFHDLACQGRIALHPGCASLIDDALEDGCKLAIVTDLPARTAAVLLERAFDDRLTDMFATIASSANVDSTSDNNAYHLVLRTVATDPWRSVAIESTVPALLAAQRAGLWTLATTPFIDDMDSIAGADAWYPDLRASGHSRKMATVADAGQGRFISFDVLDALKNASRLKPSFAGITASAWA